LKADIAEMKISITMWGAKKGNWIEFYTDIKEIIDNLGYEHTHIGIKNGKFSSGKIMTVKRKEKEIFESINGGDLPLSFSLYSLPKNYKVASFDYDFLCERNDSYISVIIKENDYNASIEKTILSVLEKYIDLEYGEVYSVLASEMPLLYAETRDTKNLKTYSMIKILKNRS
jgi:hypothetical protein